MPAPTALLRNPESLEQAVSDQVTTVPDTADDVLLDPEALPDSNEALEASAAQDEMEVEVDEENRPKFKPNTAVPLAFRSETRRVTIPPNRLTPLKNEWPKIYPPLVEHLKLMVRFNIRTKAVELRNTKNSSGEALQMGADFIKAFALGFDLADAIALLRVENLYIQSFDVKDVKRFSSESDHLSRAIGRIAGKDGKTKFAIENASRTRLVIAGTAIHILGGFAEINVAREAVVSLILGAPPGKVYGNLRTVASRMKERF